MFLKISEISTFSTSDTVLLIGHYNSLFKDTGVDPRIFERGYTEAQIKAMRKQMGNKNDGIVSAGFRIKGDLKRFEHPYFSYLITGFNQYQRNGVLPFVGGLSDQPAIIIEAYQVLDQLDFERKEKLRVEAEREARKNGRR